MDTEKWIGKKSEAEPFLRDLFYFPFLFSFRSFISVKNTVASVKAVSETISNVQDLIHHNQYHCPLPVFFCIIL